MPLPDIQDSVLRVGLSRSCGRLQSNHAVNLGFGGRFAEEQLAECILQSFYMLFRAGLRTDALDCVPSGHETSVSLKQMGKQKRPGCVVVAFTRVPFRCESSFATTKLLNYAGPHNFVQGCGVGTLQTGGNQALGLHSYLDELLGVGPVTATQVVDSRVYSDWQRVGGAGQRLAGMTALACTYFICSYAVLLSSAIEAVATDEDVSQRMQQSATQLHN